jgi:hypothetical protein
VVIVDQPCYQIPTRAGQISHGLYSLGAMIHDIFALNPKRLPHEELTAPGAIGPVIEKCTKRNAHRRYKDVQ